MAAALLEVRKLGKRFAQRHGREPSPWVIQDLSFSVAAGEFLTIVGPSGAGKSTLLNIIAQIDTASAGEIVFDGTPVTTRDPRALRPGFDRRIGYVTQDDNLLPWRSTLDNVLFSLDVQGRLNDETRAHARDADPRGRARRLRALLSARALRRHAQAHRAHPHPGLRPAGDPDGRAVRRGRRADPHAAPGRPAQAVGASGKKTIIFVTHDITEAIALGDRALVLSRQPSRIAAEHMIPIPRPRNVKDIFALEGFAATYEKIRADVQ